MYLNLGSAIGLKDLLFARGPVGVLGSILLLGGLVVLINGLAEKTPRKRRTRLTAGIGAAVAGASIVGMAQTA